MTGPDRRLRAAARTEARNAQTQNRALAAAALALLVLGGLSACGKGAADDGVATASSNQPTTSASGVPAAANMQKFTQCIRDNGLDVPDVNPDTGRPDFRDIDDVDRSAMQKAMEACRSLMPNGGARPTLDAAQLEQMRGFAQCMRDNGLPNFPDPDANGGIGLGGGGVGADPLFDRNNLAFQKALEACRSKLPQLRGGSRP